MKKLLIGLAVSLLTVLLGAAGYLMATEFLPSDDMGKAVP